MAGDSGAVCLGEWALRLKYDTERALTHPSAYMVPANVKGLLAEQSALLGQMAREIDKIKGGK